MSFVFESDINSPSWASPANGKHGVGLPHCRPGTRGAFAIISNIGGDDAIVAMVRIAKPALD